MRCDICDGTTIAYPGATLFVCEPHFNELKLSGGWMGRPRDFEIERGEWWVTQ